MTNDACFHCGEDIPEHINLSVDLNGETKSLCCLGCHAVSQAILDAGLTHYYQYRTESAKTAPLVPQELETYKSYDLPEIQQEFVENKESLSSAYISIEGLTCAACAWLIESKLKQLEGIHKVHVNFGTHRAHLRWNNDVITLSKILETIHRIGYRSSPFQQQDDEERTKKQSRRFLVRLGFSGLATMQVMMLALGLYSGYFSSIDLEMRHYFRWVSLCFSLPVATYCAFPFYESAFRALKNKRINMDVPVSIALIFAFTASCLATFSRDGDVYFESVSMFTFFLLLSRFFEKKAFQHAAEQRSNLHKLLPLTATVVNNNQHHKIVAAKLQQDQIILVAAGETIACDGIILDGHSSIQESMLTGEQKPNVKKSGDFVYCGSINIDQPITIQIKALGKQTFISHLIDLQEQASFSKPKIALLAEKIAQYVTPTILLLAGATYLFWTHYDPANAFWIMLSVLIATCPCALALATPTAVTCATTALQKIGIMTRVPDLFERLTKINTVVFDKTGTLTSGKFSITDIDVEPNLTKTEALHIASALEQQSIHPIALTFQQAFASTKHVSNPQTHVGQGVSGTIEDDNYQLGSAAWTKQQGSHHQVHLVKNGQAIARFKLSDDYREHMKTTIDHIKQAKLSIAIASGDQETNVQDIARKLGISKFYSAMSPEDKLSYIQSIQKDGARVAFFGDGINDAPVLAAADLSIAMGSGATIAQHQADVVLLSDSIEQFPRMLYLAKKTTRIIRQNFGWAILYNASVIPLAITGNLPPYIAALGMSLSSIIVTSNSLRLLRSVR